MGKSCNVERRVSGVKRYSPEQERVAYSVLREVTVKGASTDVEALMQGAQLCYDLCGQELFRFVTQILYSRAKKPGAVHQAIAELAPALDSTASPDRGRPKSGWQAIITYNFDALVSEALAERNVPHAVWGMNANELAVTADRPSRDSPWQLPIFHLHGYTPRHPFLITNTGFVFSTSQYQTVYKDSPRSKILQLVYDRALRNPVHVAPVCRVFIYGPVYERPARRCILGLPWPLPLRAFAVAARPTRERTGLQCDSARVGEISRIRRAPDLVRRFQRAAGLDPPFTITALLPSAGHF
jgi:SIR2-like domain